MVVTGWFGWSVLWLLPLSWRLAKAFLFKKAQLRGQGYIRLWIGTVVLLGASSALEAFIRQYGSSMYDDALVGQWIASVIVDSVGLAFGVLLLLATIVVTLPWLFGRRALDLVRWCVHAGKGAAKGRERRDNRVVLRTPFPVSAAPIREKVRAAGSAPISRTETWKLPATFFGREAVRKAPLALTPRKEQSLPVARSSEEWAPFERIRPTSAMLARAKARENAEGRQLRGAPVRIVLSPQSTGSTITKTTTLGRSTVPVQPMPPAAPFRMAANAHQQPGGIAPRQTGMSETTTGVEQKVDCASHGESDALVPQAAEALPGAVNVAETRIETETFERSASACDVQVNSLSGDTQPAVQTAMAVPVSAALGMECNVVDPEMAMPSVPQLSIPSSSADSMIEAVAAPNSGAPQAAVVPRLTLAESFAFQAPSEVDVELPGLNLLDAHTDAGIEVSPTELAETGSLIEQRLREFKVPATVLGASAGPVITRFEIEPAVGVRGAQIVGLMKDLSRALGLTSIRVVETIPGKTCMGLELPNRRRQMIQLSEILASDAYCKSRSHLTLAMGKDITGEPVVTDLARAPHMLVAGTTGSGKSVAINAMILSLLFKSTPADVRLIMIDPKMLELSVYDGIPHLLAPVVTDMKLAANALSWCVGEMEKRYRLMSALGVRNLAGFNQKILDGKAVGKLVTNPFSLTPDAPEPLSTLPTIVVVIDELADLMMVAGKKIEELIARLAQKARAAGIHLILATQRPSVDVITGLIKANIPTRVAFQVSSKIDSRTVLDQMGAETLLGHGDMLFLPPGSGYPQRVHGAFVSDEEVHRVVEYLKQFGEPEYEEAILAGAPSEEAAPDLFGDTGGAESDPLYDEAVAFVIRSRRASISAVQRQLRIGYNRAARLVEQMETAGILSPMATNGSREVLVPPSQT